ncbi:hypothetical protein, variant [Exophiala mesophila]|uniref:glucan endo-1,3-beta-D-glucosidase n=1 Tax=Exophiala mesophila TaxID=212818 RepID=A0A0D1XT25_EXOME|nr:uncharacterized protein PV10_05847 [Exophiala mesophila]XP_016222870.1 hypothetical protein, variant [Exophiala mesophila]KIV91295.1 hypothetical protein PV10_05847 [Exophiala mesophila]KIV91296.1 hypothetical protein, variant [Exophiala mesophila]
MPPDRQFSFETHDDYPRDNRPHPEPPSHQQYTDSPSRDFVSPPPRYTSPAAPAFAQASPPRRPIPPDPRYLSDQSPSRRQPLLFGGHDDLQPPPPPPHRSSPSRISSDSQHRPISDVTSDMDNYGDYAQGGGINAVAQGVADRHPRESGLQAMGSLPQPYAPVHSDALPYSRDGLDHAQLPPSHLPNRNSYGSTFALAAGAATPGTVTPDGSLGPRSSRFSGRSIPLEDYSSHPSQPTSYMGYQESPYQNNPHSPSINSSNIMHHASINPHNILDDGDDGFPSQPRGSTNAKGNRLSGIAGAAAGAGVLGGLFGRRAKNHTSSGTYDAVGESKVEKSAWLAGETKGRRKMKLWVGVGIGLVIVLAIVGGVVGGLLGSRSSSSGSDDTSSPASGSTNNADDDTAANGDLSKDSSEIKALMNNKNLHRVFPGMDYTPWGTQYPLCHTYPPSQNNVTRDMAVLNQLTNVVRLYGTDCNQTQMVLHAIDRLELTDMKVWMGVWIDTNATTSARQLEQMYQILKETKDLSIFKGVIVGNEALYRAGEDKAQSEQELIDMLNQVRSNFSRLGYDLPVATSDLGDNWNSQLVQAVDYVMSNIHPFFAGVDASLGAGWTWDFWQTHNVILTTSLPDVGQIISETGWPSGGGTDCGGLDGSCTPGQKGAVASIDGLNTFMDTWVCQALANGTDYFWFEAFDEPWKVAYNKGDQNWEDKWGLMDPGRNLKPGLIIPDCGGKTV